MDVMNENPLSQPTLSLSTNGKDPIPVACSLRRSQDSWFNVSLSHVAGFFSSSLLLSSLELSDTKSMSLKYEPASESLHISVK